VKRHTKNYIGAPQEEDETARSFARLTKKFVDRVDTGASTTKLFDHCCKSMEIEIAKDFKAGGALSGHFPTLNGLPSEEEYAEWNRKAGYKEGGIEHRFLRSPSSVMAGCEIGDDCCDVEEEEDDDDDVDAEEDIDI
jgi:hypothetical protein